MTRITSKLQVSIPKALADRLGLRPGDDLDWEAAGDTLRARAAAAALPHGTAIEARLAAFDAATDRQVARQRVASKRPKADASNEPKRPPARGWTREDLYDR